ncbi:hypothetical protein P3342_007949 [Pyrenophora teres f. teres]|nr:hypothetical protein P3342_007949 [Pyrenophora teres f. teres]
MIYSLEHTTTTASQSTGDAWCGVVKSKVSNTHVYDFTPLFFLRRKDGKSPAQQSRCGKCITYIPPRTDRFCLPTIYPPRTRTRPPQRPIPPTDPFSPSASDTDSDDVKASAASLPQRPTGTFLCDSPPEYTSFATTLDLSIHPSISTFVFPRQPSPPPSGIPFLLSNRK